MSDNLSLLSDMDTNEAQMERDLDRNLAQYRQIQRNGAEVRRELQRANSALEATNRDLRATNQTLEATNRTLETTSQNLEADLNAMQAERAHEQHLRTTLEQRAEEVDQRNAYHEQLQQDIRVLRQRLDNEIQVRRNLAERLIEAKGVCSLVRPKFLSRTSAAYVFQDQTVTMTEGAIVRSYPSFDYVFEPNVTNADVWTEAECFVDTVFRPEPRPLVLFACGKTNTGKTHLLTENQVVTDPIPPETSLMPRAIHRAFNNATQLANDGQRVTIEADCCEVTFTAGAEAINNCHARRRLANLVDAMTFLDTVHRDRSSRDTSGRAGGGNVQSSRTHLVLVLHVGVGSPDSRLNWSSVTLIDLAGDEKAEGTRASDTFRESVAINESLGKLKRVLKHVTRDSRMRIKASRTHNTSELDKVKCLFKQDTLQGLLKDVLFNPNRRILFIATVFGGGLETFASNKHTLDFLCELLGTEVPVSIAPSASASASTSTDIAMPRPQPSLLTSQRPSGPTLRAGGRIPRAVPANTTRAVPGNTTRAVPGNAPRAAPGNTTRTGSGVERGRGSGTG